MALLFRWSIALIIGMTFSIGITIILNSLQISNNLLLLIIPVYSTTFGALAVGYLINEL